MILFLWTEIYMPTGKDMSNFFFIADFLQVNPTVTKRMESEAMEIDQPPQKKTTEKSTSKSGHVPWYLLFCIFCAILKLLLLLN